VAVSTPRSPAARSPVAILVKGAIDRASRKATMEEEERLLVLSRVAGRHGERA
jgi:hypothetical protein